MELEEKRKFFEVIYNEDEVPDFSHIFGNDNPIHLEIGSGRGEFILEKSVKNANINFIGIDVKEKRIKTILRKLDIQKNSNVRLIKMFIDRESIKFFSQQTFERIYLLFPDPWPKRKHHRRRIINKEFIEILHKLLKKNGILQIVTDHSEYAEWIKSYFKKSDCFKPFYKDCYTRIPDENHIQTYFEKKMRNEGFVPYYFKFKRI